MHGFYIVMGGFVLDVSKDKQQRLWPRQIDRLTLGSRAVLACLISQDKGLRDVLPYLSEDEIWDRSKANGLAKTIVCIQALWFCTQCIVRLAQGIPISLLELNTFAHALCALLVYILWWDKPLDIQEPTPVDINSSDATRYICAFGWSGPQGPVPHLQRAYPSEGSSWRRLLFLKARAFAGLMKNHLGDGAVIDTQPDQGTGPKPRVCAVVHQLERPSFLQRQPTQFVGMTSEERKSRVWVSTDPPVFSLEACQQLPSTSVFVSKSLALLEVDEILLSRLRLVEELRTLDNYPAYEAAFAKILDSVDPDHSMLKKRELNFTDSLMRQTSDVSPVSRNITATLGILLSGVLYGGLHMAAWNSTTFNSPAEQTIWRVSCCIVAVGGLLMASGIMALDIVNESLRTNHRAKVIKFLVALCAPIYIAFTLLYLASRVFLVFEVFRNLAYLDPRVYQTPDVGLHRQLPSSC